MDFCNLYFYGFVHLIYIYTRDNYIEFVVIEILPQNMTKRVVLCSVAENKVLGIETLNKKMITKTTRNSVFCL